MWQTSKNSYYDKTQKLKFLQNSKTQIVTKQKLWELKNLNCDESQILIKIWNSNSDKTQKIKWWQNFKTQIAIKLRKSNCGHNANWDQTKKVSKLKNSNCDKTQNINWCQYQKCKKTQTQLWQNFFVTSFSHIFSKKNCFTF